MNLLSPAGRRQSLIASSIVATQCFFCAAGHAQTMSTTELASLQLDLIDQGWGTPGKDKSISGKPISIAGQTFVKGLGTHAPTELRIQTNGASRFTAKVGLDDAANTQGTIEFFVSSEGNQLWSSGIMKRGDAAKSIDISLFGVNTLTLRVGEGGDSNANDHADWAEARFEGGKPAIIPIAGSEKWLDTAGNMIQAHGGGILKQGNTYYWYGEDKTQGAFNKVGVAGYQSQDLKTWNPMGTVMPSAGFPVEFQDKAVCERPKVIYNAKTKKYVMWAHLDSEDYQAAKAGVCVADKPEGPFKFVRAFRPVPTSTFRDMNLFVDDDGSGYVFYAGDGNATMYIMKLSDDYLDIASPSEEGKTWTKILTRSFREAPAPFKYNGRYYLVTSGCSGWSPNPGGYATAPSVLGPWTAHGNPFKGLEAETSFRSQPTFVIANPAGKPSDFIYLGDRWKSSNLGDSRYVWLPFSIKPDGSFEINRNDGWRPK